MSAKKNKLILFSAYTLFTLSCIFLLFILVSRPLLVTKKRSRAQNPVESITLKKESPQKEIAFWKGFLNENPDYFPGWVELAKIQLEQNNTSGYNYAIYKGKEINPNTNLF